MSDSRKNTPPLKPTALINFKKTDDELAKIIGNFWKLTWNKENPAIDQKTKYLLSLANAVGAGRLSALAKRTARLEPVSNRRDPNPGTEAIRKADDNLQSKQRLKGVIPS